MVNFHNKGMEHMQYFSCVRCLIFAKNINYENDPNISSVNFINSYNGIM